MKLRKLGWYLRSFVWWTAYSFRNSIQRSWNKTRNSWQGNVYGEIVTLSFEAFYQFWQTNPYNWHCRPFYVYYQDKEGEQKQKQIKDEEQFARSIGMGISLGAVNLTRTRTYVTFNPIDLHIYQGWRDSIQAGYRAEEKIYLKEEAHIATIQKQALKDKALAGLLNSIQKDIEDTNDQALAYYAQANEYLEQIQEETNNE